ncbi:MAG: succinate dehydrogenase [Pseudomonadota bacterium]
MISLPLYMAQRISALIMVPLVFGHLALMIHAIRGGLTAEEILGRTQGNLGWAAFYGLFVLAVSVHAAIGLRAIAFEWGGLRGHALDLATWAIGVGLLVMGLRAVGAVTWG